ncbi:MAG: hypothetical protein N3G22_00435 [Candidatus Micrarchaeota archaeon]|nr:hypothetical protein [Candidatus Micrarchaeota archaeon]
MSLKEKTIKLDFSIPIFFKGSWPPDTSLLAAAGFDSISISSRALKITKVHGTDLVGTPNNMTQITIQKGSATITILAPSQTDEEAAKMRAILIFLRVARLIPGLSAELSKVSELILPSLEVANSIFSSSYDSLLKRHKDLEELFYEEQKKNKQLAKMSEELAASNLDLEKQVGELKEWRRRLETLPDEALCELVLDWVNTHRGTFSLPSFSKATGVPPARAEEGLEMLLKKGVLRRLKSGFAQESSLAERQFEVKGLLPGRAKDSIYRWLRNTFSSSIKNK